MAHDKRIQAEVETTLASLDRMESLVAGPAYVARLQSRLASVSRGKAVHSSFPLFPRWWAPVLRPALLLAMIMINLATIALVAQKKITVAKVNTVSVSTVATDYALNQDLDDLIFPSNGVSK